VTENVREAKVTDDSHGVQCTARLLDSARAVVDG